MHPVYKLEHASKAKKQSSQLPLILAGITGGLAAAISAICYPFVSPAFRNICLPYMPATTMQVKNILKALEGRHGTLVDLGSGDGRIVHAAAKAGFIAHGVELNFWLVQYSKFIAAINGLSSKTAFYRKDIWKFNLESYDNIVVFGVQEMMQKLEQKFLSDLNKNCMVVACRFPLPNIQPINIIGKGIDTVWIYKIYSNDP
ncbi:ATP synthase subunit C lysine N-methyltransferase [Prorops nasuta]|uniref:ATP synthase subunit C lysine N-methyltransferase n=1 Tax=Prorops nasuta TaxID=863751 RepID=UPI0034CEFFEE